MSNPGFGVPLQEQPSAYCPTCQFPACRQDVGQACDVCGDTFVLNERKLPIYTEAHWLAQLAKLVKRYFFALLEDSDKYTALSALAYLVATVRGGEELSEADEQLLDSLNFAWLLEDAQLDTYSVHLAERIERRGYVLIGTDGRVFYEHVLKLLKQRLA